VKNYDTYGANRNQNEGQEAKKEPSSAAASLIGGLSDAEGTEEGGGERLEESHEVMVRRPQGPFWEGGAGGWKNPQRYGHIESGNWFVACCKRRPGLD
jgi:hypothetical protein